jgi:ABC-type lipoprotein export system ATPase subunit
MTQSTVQLEQVCKNYGDGELIHALRDVNLSVAQGERIAVMGPPGSGKSSLLKLVCGLDNPTSGIVSVAGIKISDLNDDQRTGMRREKIRVIFQTFNLLTTLTAVENAALSLRLQGMRRKEAEQCGRNARTRRAKDSNHASYGSSRIPGHEIVPPHSRGRARISTAPSPPCVLV